MKPFVVSPDVLGGEVGFRQRGQAAFVKGVDGFRAAQRQVKAAFRCAGDLLEQSFVQSRFDDVALVVL